MAYNKGAYTKAMQTLSKQIKKEKRSTLFIKGMRHALSIIQKYNNYEQATPNRRAN